VPVFEYRCGECSHELEAIVLPSEDAPTICPECGGELIRRWSRVGVQLVGWGFARNDALLGSEGKRRPFKQIRDKASELFD
jgi:putative FmdB family regulatory protein